MFLDLTPLFSVIEQAGEGNDTVFTNLTYTLGDNLENLSLLSTLPFDPLDSLISVDAFPDYRYDSLS